MRTIAFIFARGGSKGIPRKNVKLLMGKPLIQYSIEVAQSCAFIHELYVSTDDDEIAHMAKGLGAKVIRRPGALATDQSPEWLSWQHGVSWVQEHAGNFDCFVSLPVTAPLRNIDDVRRGVELFGLGGADVCVSVSPSHRNPFFNMLYQTSAGNWELVNSPGTEITRRQDCPKCYDMTTVCYVSSPSFILNSSSMFDGKLAAVEVPKERALDIDDEYDFVVAEALVKKGIHNRS